MLPLYILTSAKNEPVLVSLKEGGSVNGILVEVDFWMNLTLKDVVETSSDGKTFLKLPEILIKGRDIKDIRLPEHLIGDIKSKLVQSQEQRYQRNRNNNSYDNSNSGNYRNNRNNNGRNNNGQRRNWNHQNAHHDRQQARN